MSEIELCAECGIPLMVSGELSWDANGVISSKRSSRNRWVFFESENIDPLFKGMEELIGMPIEHIVIESRCRETRRFIERTFPAEMREPLAELSRKMTELGSAMEAKKREGLLSAMRAVTMTIINISKAYGYGRQRPGDLWEEDADHPWRTQVIRDPYSLLFISADNLGSVEAFENVDMQVKHEEIEPNTFRIDVQPGKHPIELEERLKRTRYDLKSGNIHYQRCRECGVPEDIGRYTWDLEEGTITDPDTGRRIAVLGPSAIDAIFDDLQTELGEAVPETIIEAERRYIRSAWGGDEWLRRAPDFKRLIALRGLGNLVHFEGDRDHLALRIENSCLHLPMIGIVQAIVEMAYRRESSTYEWDFAEDGDLTITVRL
jgi:hypothetical protein